MKSYKVNVENLGVAGTIYQKGDVLTEEQLKGCDIVYSVSKKYLIEIAPQPVPVVPEPVVPVAPVEPKEDDTTELVVNPEDLKPHVPDLVPVSPPKDEKKKGK